MFFSDFSTLLELINNIPGRVLLAGDLNLHMDNLQDTDASILRNLLSLAGFTQHVTGSTHNRGHKLDLLITRDADDAISDITLHSDLPSDHFVTLCYLNIYYALMWSDIKSASAKYTKLTPTASRAAL